MRIEKFFIRSEKKKEEDDSKKSKDKEPEKDIPKKTISKWGSVKLDDGPRLEEQVTIEEQVKSSVEEESINEDRFSEFLQKDFSRGWITPILQRTEVAPNQEQMNIEQELATTPTSIAEERGAMQYTPFGRTNYIPAHAEESERRDYETARIPVTLTSEHDAVRRQELLNPAKGWGFQQQRTWEEPRRIDAEIISKKQRLPFEKPDDKKYQRVNIE
ncbi:MAG: hypothetical protein KKA64_01245 [Nanoarchaeota archaeon]|nr:hypothetical protein [Nanoarchaeota archaeon]